MNKTDYSDELTIHSHIRCNSYTRFKTFEIFQFVDTITSLENDFICGIEIETLTRKSCD